MQPAPAAPAAQQVCHNVRWDLTGPSDKVERSFLLSCRQGCCRGELALLPAQPRQMGSQPLAGAAGAGAAEGRAWCAARLSLQEKREAGVAVTSQTELAELSAE